MTASSSTTVDVPDNSSSSITDGAWRSHVSRLVHRLREMRKQDILCDGIVQCVVNDPDDPRDGLFYQVSRDTQHQRTLASWY